MSKMNFIKVRFDVRRADIDQDWLDNRYLFFQKYTLPSLLQQSFTDWILWVQCQKGMEDKVSLLEEILQSVQEQRPTFRYVMTFGDEPISTFTKYFNDDESKRFDRADYFYITRIDSDDLYSSQALSHINRVQPFINGNVESSMFRRGYIHDLLSGRVGTYVSPSTPFHTLMIPGPIYRDEKRYFQEVWSKAGDHSKVSDHFRLTVLPDYQFTVLIHGQNFLSDFDYARDQKEYVNKNWSLRSFQQNPIVFDVDDFCDQYNCLNELIELQKVYPNFQCTLFTIPEKTSPALLKRAKELGFMELAVHGIRHEPNEEMKIVSREQLETYLQRLDYSIYTRGFRPPGWYINREIIKALNENGHWIALHTRDVSSLRDYCQHGYYACGERYQYWHGHTHNVCGNWLKQHLPQLLQQWNRNQMFYCVSDAVLVHPNTKR